MAEIKEHLPKETNVPEAIIPQANNLQNFDPEQEVQYAQKAAKALMTVIEATKPLKMNGKTYMYFEHWQTIARFFHATVGIDWTKEIKKGADIYGYEAKSLLYQNGTVIGGAEASCTRDEANWKSKPDFQIRSMAQTRAMAKALRSVFGYVAVLAGVEATPAEELEPVKKKAPQVPKSSITASKLGDVAHTGYFCSVHDNTIILRPAGVTKQGKEYPSFYACSKKDNGAFCKAPILNSEGEIVQNTPNGMELVQSSVDKARNILNGKLPIIEITREDMP